KFPEFPHSSRGTIAYKTRPHASLRGLQFKLWLAVVTDATLWASMIGVGLVPPVPDPTEPTVHTSRTPPNAPASDPRTAASAPAQRRRRPGCRAHRHSPVPAPARRHVRDHVHRARH